MKIQPISMAAMALSLVVVSTTAQDQSERQRSGNTESNAFLGTWKLDPSRTKVGAVTLSYEQVGDSIRTTTPRGAYTFKIDGAEYPTAVKGESIIWRQVDKSTIETTSKRDGKVQAISTRVFSPDGKSASVSTKLMGDTPSTFTAKLERQAGPSSDTNPLIGTWKQTRDVERTGLIAYTPAANGLHVRYEGPLAQEYDLIFDGKEHNVEAADPSSFIARKVNDRTIEEKWSRDGTLFTTSTIKVSADGQELIEQTEPGQPNIETSTYVYRRAK